jgi:hypothetical protein
MFNISREREIEREREREREQIVPSEMRYKKCSFFICMDR